MSTEPLTWQDLLDECSRLYTTRTRPEIPWEPEGRQREDSHVLHVLITAGRIPARITPTRMHEPGFYAWVGPRSAAEIWRSEGQLAYLKSLADGGLITRAETVGGLG